MQALKWPSHQDLLTSWIEVFELALEHPIGLKGSDLASLPEPTQLKLIHENLVNYQLMPRRSTPDALRGPLHTFAAALRCQYYPAKAFKGTVHLGFVGNATALATPTPFIADVMLKGWEALAERVETFILPGNHITTLKVPHVQVINSRLNSIIASRRTGASRFDHNP
jgi:arthrofactin-type cyclic lipopeptide synthetase C